MPKGIYIRYKSPWNKGLTNLTDSRVYLNSLSRTGMKRSPDICKKCSESTKLLWKEGKITGIKGQTKETNVNMLKAAIKKSNKMKGKPSPVKGMKWSIKSKRLQSKSQKKRFKNKGKIKKEILKWKSNTE